MKKKPCIYIHVSGGIIQNISATEEMDVIVFDKDLYNISPDNMDYNPVSWKDMIQEKTINKELISIY